MDGGGDSPDLEARRQAIVDSYRIVCICNKIRRGTILKAIDAGATTPADVRRMTRAGGGPCKAERCGPRVVEMLRLARVGTCEGGGG